ncbi:MAG: hypothetical protein WC836_24340 [Desulfobacula sp.]|jgi:hypothetical protein
MLAVKFDQPKQKTIKKGGGRCVEQTRSFQSGGNLGNIVFNKGNLKFKRKIQMRRSDCKLYSLKKFFREGFMNERRIAT